jgi:uncharacterized protein (TIGR03067 family)
MALRVLVPVACLLLAADGPPTGDLERLQGAWAMASYQQAGKSLPDDVVKGCTLTIKGAQWVAKSGVAEAKVAFTLDASKTPKTIDMAVGSGARAYVSPGIYKLEGDTLTICRPLLPRDPKRPKEFTGEDSAVVMIVWKRVKK